MITNNPRYMVIQRALTSPRELIDNRVGGIANGLETRWHITYAAGPLNPFVFQTSKCWMRTKRIIQVYRDYLGSTKTRLASKIVPQWLSNLPPCLSKDRRSSQGALLTIRQTTVQRNLPSMRRNETKKIFEVAGDYVAVDPAS